MSDLIIELFSEEMPPNLQISARNQLKKILKDELSSINLLYKSFEIYSTPTRLTVFISGIPKKIKVLPSEIKGPKVGVPENIVQNFARSKRMSISADWETRCENIFIRAIPVGALGL